MRNNYDKIAPWYDRLSRMVFGKAQVRAQTALLPHIPAGSHVLIIGGGTGWILEELAKIHSAPLHITYVEISMKMLELSRQRNAGNHIVEFVHLPIEDYQPTNTYDVIFTAFLFDNFTAEKINRIFPPLHACLVPNGSWLYVDFQDKPGVSTWWQRALLKTMHIFFHVVCRIEATHLVDMEPVFEAASYTILFRKDSFKGFIRSIVYQKN